MFDVFSPLPIYSVFGILFLNKFLSENKWKHSTDSGLWYM